MRMVQLWEKQRFQETRRLIEKHHEYRENLILKNSMLWCQGRSNYEQFKKLFEDEGSWKPSELILELAYHND